MALPLLFLALGAYRCFVSPAQSWPSSSLFDQLQSSSSQQVFLPGVLLLVLLLTFVFQWTRTQLWRGYIVPKHLQLQR